MRCAEGYLGRVLTSLVRHVLGVMMCSWMTRARRRSTSSVSSTRSRSDTDPVTTPPQVRTCPSLFFDTSCRTIHHAFHFGRLLDYFIARLYLSALSVVWWWLTFLLLVVLPVCVVSRRAAVPQADGVGLHRRRGPRADAHRLQRHRLRRGVRPRLTSLIFEIAEPQTCFESVGVVENGLMFMSRVARLTRLSCNDAAASRIWSTSRPRRRSRPAWTTSR